MFFQHQPGAQAKRYRWIREQNIFSGFLHLVTLVAIFRQQNAFAKRGEVQRVGGHMQPEGLAAASDLLYDPIAHDRLLRWLGCQSPEQRAKRKMRWREAREIVLAKR